MFLHLSVGHSVHRVEGVHGKGGVRGRGVMRGGGHAWQGVCMADGPCMAGGMRGSWHAWQGGVHGKVGGMCAWQDRRHCSGRYAIYWNALYL